MHLSLLSFLALAINGLRFEIVATAGQGTLRCFEQFALEGQEIRGQIDIPNEANQQVDFLV